MGRKGSWFSAIKRVFTSNSKDKLPYEIENKSSHEKKARRRLKHGESISFFPLFREPSSIEKILGEVDQQLLFIGHPTPVDRPTTPQPSFSGPPASPRVTSHRAESPRVPSPRAVSPRNSSPRVVHRRTEISYRPEPTLRNRHLSATIIQAAYRGYMARRSFRALRGLVRLQGAVRGQNAKRQTINAMKQMQLFVRVQTQIQWRRIQTLENQTPERQTFKNVKEVVIGNGHWDDSLITKEKKEARLQKKMEAIIKRERAMAYAYSHKLWNATPKSAQNTLTDIRSGGYPWWWNRLDRQVPSNEPTKPPKFSPTPPRSNLYNKTSRSKAGSPYPMKDSDSLTSCPPVPVPNYMSLTVSAKAKVRPTGNPKDKLISTAASETSSNRRFSFPVTQNIGSSFKWNKNSASKDSTTSQAKRVLEKHKSPRSIGNMSIDSTISMPAAFGRKPFNRFV